jgi:hypothetical protein
MFLLKMEVLGPAHVWIEQSNLLFLWKIVLEHFITLLYQRADFAYSKCNFCFWHFYKINYAMHILHEDVKQYNYCKASYLCKHKFCKDNLRWQMVHKGLFLKYFKLNFSLYEFFFLDSNLSISLLRHIIVNYN